MSASDFTQVTKRKPCPACGKPDWCAWTEAGYLKCERSTEPPPGFVRVSIRNNGAVFAPEGKEYTGSTPKPSKPSDAPVRFETLEDGRQHWRQRWGRREAAEYLYESAAGEGVGVALRFNTPGGGKAFMPLSRAPGGGWYNTAPSKPWPLYRLPTLAEADEILVVEGEACAEVAAECGLTVTTNWGGAGKSAHADYSPLAGKIVYVLPDNDVPGRVHSEAVAHQCRNAGASSVRWLDLTRRWPDFPNKGDLVEAKDLAGGVDELRTALRELMDSAPDAPAASVLADGTSTPRKARAITRRMSDVVPKPVDWLWDGRIALGKLTILAGHPGLGKSFVTLDLAARVSRGTAWPNEITAHRDPAGVVLISAEDGVEDTISPRLIAAGANSERIVLLEAVEDTEGRERTFHLRENLDLLGEAITECEGCRLVVVDPVTAFLSEIDTHRDADVRSALAPLARLAEERHVAVLAVMHLNKGGDATAITRVSGSMGFVAAARACWGVVKDPEDSERRFVLPVKNNLAPDTGGHAYSILADEGAPRVLWEPDAVEADLDRLMRSAGGGSDEPSKLDDAAEWLREYLADGVSVPASEIRHAAEQDGHSWGTIRRAKSRIGVDSEKGQFDGGWNWRRRVSER